jgi:hypothetical protein
MVGISADPLLIGQDLALGKPVCIWKYKGAENFYFEDILLITISIGKEKRIRSFF